MKMILFGHSPLMIRSYFNDFQQKLAYFFIIIRVRVRFKFEFENSIFFGKYSNFKFEYP